MLLDRLRFDFVNVLHVATRNTFNLTSSIWQYFISDAEDLHANKAETELMLHLAPETVRMDAARDDPDRTERCLITWLPTPAFKA
jgi:creatinine amidohydrolase